MIIIQIVACMALTVSSVLFGMEKEGEATKQHIFQEGLYILDFNNKYALLTKEGTLSRTSVFSGDAIKRNFLLKANIIKTENDNYCLKLENSCGSSGILQGGYGDDREEVGNNLLDLTPAQLKTILRVRQRWPLHDNVIVIDDKRNSFSVKSINSHHDMSGCVDNASYKKNASSYGLKAANTINLETDNTMKIDYLDILLGCCFGIPQVLLEVLYEGLHPDYPDFTKKTT
jgi:hypothetical protein